MKNIDILNKLSEGNTSDWLEKAEWRRQNKSWLGNSAKIAIKVISELDRQGKTRKDLAKEMGVSPQNISKLLSGSANLGLETITRFEEVLDIKLIEVIDNKIPKSDFKNNVNTTFRISIERIENRNINNNRSLGRPLIWHSNNILPQA